MSTHRSASTRRELRRFACAAKPRLAHLTTLGLLLPLLALAPLAAPACGLAPVPESGWRLVAWNDLGMHCLDADFSAFVILPPYNTIHAQLIDPAGQLVTVPGSVTVTYEAVADATGSINRSSVGKTNF